MTVPDEYVQALRSFLTDDGNFEGVARDLEERDGDDGGNIYAALMAAALHVASRRRFGSSYTNADVVRFVAQVRVRLQRSGADIDPRTAEAVLRAILGDPAADMGVDVYAKATALPGMLAVMFERLRLSDGEMPVFLAEVHALAARTLANS